VIVLDAFSGDAVPVHLLTREALAMYLEKLRPNGVIAIHLSNIYFDLEPVTVNLAADAGCVALTRDEKRVPVRQLAEGKLPSLWVVIAKSPAAMMPLMKTLGWREPRGDDRLGVWTDDFSNVVRVFHWWRPPRMLQTPGSVIPYSASELLGRRIIR
jgi:hypothetical protein